jgi:hypothetical protein
VQNCINSIKVKRPKISNNLKEFYLSTFKYISKFCEDDFKILLWYLSKEQDETMKFTKSVKEVSIGNSKKGKYRTIDK